MGSKQKILETALDCFLEFGYEGASTALIRERSGVSNGALFHHFPSKQAIADGLYRQALKSVQDEYLAVLAARPQTLRAAVGGVIRAQLAWVEANPRWARFLYSRGHLDWSESRPDAPGRAGADAANADAVNADVYAAFREWLAPFVARGDIRDLPMVVLAAVVTGPTHPLAQRWLAGELQAPLLAFADDLVEVAVAGLTLTSSAPPPVLGRPATAEFTVRLLDAEGSVIADGAGRADLGSAPDGYARP